MGGNFYVYEHWRPDKGECFYVGKGCGKRSREMGSRNRYHKNIQNKLAILGFSVEIRFVEAGLTEDQAHSLEVSRIAFWRACGAELANLTDGGEGTSNPSLETRALMRAAKIGRKLTEEHKAKVSAASRAAQASTGFRERHSRLLKEALNRPEVKAKRSKSQKARIRTKEHYEKVAAALRGKKLSPEHRAKCRLASLGRKQRPEEIEKRRLANSGKKRPPEFCALMKSMAVGRAVASAVTKNPAALIHLDLEV